MYYRYIYNTCMYFLCGCNNISNYYHNEFSATFRPHYIVTSGVHVMTTANEIVTNTKTTMCHIWM